MRARVCFTLRAAAGLALGVATIADAQLAPIALTGTDGPLGPGLGSGVQFSGFELGNFLGGPSLSSGGSVVFGAVLAGAGIDASNDTGIWARRGGAGLSLVAREGDQVPLQASGVVFNEFFTAPQIADNHVVAFEARMAGPGIDDSNDAGLFTERDGPLTAKIHERVTQVPGSNPPLYFLDPSINNNRWVLNRHGEFASRIFWEGVGNTWGIWSDRGGVLTEYFRIGGTLTIDNTTYTFVGASNPLINASGAILSTHLIDGSQSTGGVWSDRARDGSGFGTAGVGPKHPIALPGEVAPGTGNTYAGMIGYGLAFNGNGRVAFGGQLQPGDPPSPGGLWSDGRFGVIQLIALSGEAAPGTTASFNTNSFFVLSCVLSDNNVTAFKGQLLRVGGVGASNDNGIWSNRSTVTGAPSVLRLAVREGDNVPASAGPDYTGLRFGDLSEYWINADGLVSFVTLHNDFTRALWIEQPDGTLTPVVKEFTTLDVFGDGTDVRLVTELETVNVTSATGDGRRSAFNDAADVAVRLVFADGSEGIFTTAPAVPCDAPAVITDPIGDGIQPGGSITLSVDATGTGPRKYQWRVGGTPIDGAVLPTYSITNADFDDEGLYDCVVTNACGSDTSASAFVSVAPACPADLTGSSDPNDPTYGTPDGDADGDDFFFYLDAFSTGALATCDLTGSSDPNDPTFGTPDGDCDGDDFFYYLDLFSAGCP
ncbi:MAG: choice-of-anchor tandem repeat NxxGxxAF-containing protein [Phycisphaerales bacterium JB037]